MKKPSGITNIETKVSVPASLLENHVNSMHHAYNPVKKQAAIQTQPFPGNFENINWCAEQLLVNGSIEIYFDGGSKHRTCCLIIPVSAGFLVVCTKGKDAGYKFTWSSSLS